MLGAVGRPSGLPRVAAGQRPRRCPVPGRPYFFYLVEAIIEAGGLRVMNRQLASELIVQSRWGPQKTGCLS